MRWWVVLALVAGCDGVFNLDHIHSHASADAPIDTPVDMRDGPPIADDAPELCPVGYQNLTNVPPMKRYRYVTSPATWDVAEADCEDDATTKITHLAVFADVTEMENVKVTLGMQYGFIEASVGYGRDTNAADLRQFYAVTGEPLAQTTPPWNTNEPTATTAETVVRFDSNSDLIDGPWNYSIGYLCECDHRPVTQTFVLH
jgi:hypothetical protein